MYSAMHKLSNDNLLSRIKLRSVCARSYDSTERTSIVTKIIDCATVKIELDTVIKNQ